MRVLQLADLLDGRYKQGDNPASSMISTRITRLFAVAGFATAFQMICFGGPAAAGEAPPRLNVLFITADDMNYDAPGFTANRVPDIFHPH